MCQWFKRNGIHTAGMTELKLQEPREVIIQGRASKYFSAELHAGRTEQLNMMRVKSLTLINNKLQLLQVTL